MVVIQLAGDGNVISLLREHLRADKPFAKMNKKQLLKYVDDRKILSMYERFHGENSGDELYSAVKSIYKGKQHSLPVTMATMRSLKPAAIRLFLIDFVADSQISNPKLESMNPKRKESHIKRFRYREMLEKAGKTPPTQQLQLVNQLNFGQKDEDPAPKDEKEDPKPPPAVVRGTPSAPAPAPQIDTSALESRIEAMSKSMERMSRGMLAMQRRNAEQRYADDVGFAEEVALEGRVQQQQQKLDDPPQRVKPDPNLRVRHMRREPQPYRQQWWPDGMGGDMRDAGKTTHRRAPPPQPQDVVIRHFREMREADPRLYERGGMSLSLDKSGQIGIQLKDGVLGRGKDGIRALPAPRRPYDDPDGEVFFGRTRRGIHDTDSDDDDPIFRGTTQHQDIDDESMVDFSGTRPQDSDSDDDDDKPIFRGTTRPHPKDDDAWRGKDPFMTDPVEAKAKGDPDLFAPLPQVPKEDAGNQPQADEPPLLDENVEDLLGKWQRKHSKRLPTKPPRFHTTKDAREYQAARWQWLAQQERAKNDLLRKQASEAINKERANTTQEKQKYEVLHRQAHDAVYKLQAQLTEKDRQAQAALAEQGRRADAAVKATVAEANQRFKQEQALQAKAGHQKERQQEQVQARMGAARGIQTEKFISGDQEITIVHDPQTDSYRLDGGLATSFESLMAQLQRTGIDTGAVRRRFGIVEDVPMAEAPVPAVAMGAPQIAEQARLQGLDAARQAQRNPFVVEQQRTELEQGVDIGLPSSPKESPAPNVPETPLAADMGALGAAFAQRMGRQLPPEARGRAHLLEEEERRRKLQAEQEARRDPFAVEHQRTELEQAQAPAAEQQKARQDAAAAQKEQERLRRVAAEERLRREGEARERVAAEERLRRERERVAAEERLRREREAREQERLRRERETKEQIAAEERKTTLPPIQEASAHTLPETPERVPATPDVRPQAHTGQTATQLFARTPAARLAPEEPNVTPARPPQPHSGQTETQAFARRLDTPAAQPAPEVPETVLFQPPEEDTPMSRPTPELEPTVKFEAPRAKPVRQILDFETPRHTPKVFAAIDYATRSQTSDAHRRKIDDYLSRKKKGTTGELRQKVKAYTKAERTVARMELDDPERPQAIAKQKAAERALPNLITPKMLVKYITNDKPLLKPFRDELIQVQKKYPDIRDAVMLVRKMPRSDKQHEIFKALVRSYLPDVPLTDNEESILARASTRQWFRFPTTRQEVGAILRTRAAKEPYKIAKEALDSLADLKSAVGRQKITDKELIVSLRDKLFGQLTNGDEKQVIQARKIVHDIIATGRFDPDKIGLLDRVVSDDRSAKQALLGLKHTHKKTRRLSIGANMPISRAVLPTLKNLYSTLRNKMDAEEAALYDEIIRVGNTSGELSIQKVQQLHDYAVRFADRGFSPLVAPLLKALDDARSEPARKRRRPGVTKTTVGMGFGGLGRLRKKVHLEHYSIDDVKAQLKKDKPKQRATALKRYQKAHKKQPRDEYASVIKHIKGLERKRKVGFKSKIQTVFI